MALAAGLLLCAPPPARAVSSATPTGAHGGASHGPQGYLGIDVRDLSEEQVNALRLKDTHGAEIIRVDHDGPAGKMGLREHDIVLQMNGVAVEGQEHIRRMLHECAPGRTVVLLISRDGQQLTLTAQMADRGEVERQAWELHLTPGTPPGGPQAPSSALPSGDVAANSSAPSAPAPTSRYSKSFLGTLLTSPSYTGAMLEMMGPQLAEYFGVPGGAGLLVRSVVSNSPASIAGMRAGDIIVRTNLQPVSSPSRFAKTIREAKGRPVTITVLRDRKELNLTLIPDGKHRSSLELPPSPFESVTPESGDTVYIVRLVHLAEL